VLAKVEQVHREIGKDGVRADEAVKAVVRHFELRETPLLAAFVKFVEDWHEKAIVETGSPAEFLEYLDYFVEAKGSIALPRSTADAVQLLTAHAAKGLEFQHVAIDSRVVHFVSLSLSGAAGGVSGGVAAVGCSSD
jgi:superfamily I DNA/RNA helicase